jgi:hypothetical protein
MSGERFASAARVRGSTFEDARIRIGEGEFEDILGEVDGDGGDGGRSWRSMHGGAEPASRVGAIQA